MSYVSVVNKMLECKNYEALQALYYVMKKVDYNKLVDRVVQAKINTDIPTKCVLLEYNYTPWELTNLGLNDKSERLHGTDMFVHNAFKLEEFQTLLKTVLIQNNPHIHVYVRSRINSDGVADLHIWQLVMLFDPGALQSEDDCIH